MRFLIVSKSKHPMPPEMAPGLLDAMSGWAKKYTANKKMEQIWAFAGTPAGGGVLNVGSLDELDSIMAEYPFGPFSDTEVYPLVDLHDSLQRSKQVMQSMMASKR